jgi:hypothetical protein
MLNQLPLPPGAYLISARRAAIDLDGATLRTLLAALVDDVQAGLA